MAVFDIQPEEERSAAYARGLGEEIRVRLSHWSEELGIRVVDTEGYEPKGRQVNEISATLQAGSVLRGTVRVEGQERIVFLELLDGRKRSLVWSEFYPRPLGDRKRLFLSAYIAAKVASLVGSRAGPAGLILGPDLDLSRLR